MEVLENIRNQPLGDGTVADLALPEDFLKRVADRIVRSSFEERYRIVVEDTKEHVPETPGLAAGGGLVALLALVVALIAVAWVLMARLKGRGAA